MVTTDAQKRAIANYRIKNKDKCNAFQRKYYHDHREQRREIYQTRKKDPFGKFWHALCSMKV